MEGDWVFFCRFITTTFFGHDMQELRAFQVAHVLQRGDKPQHIVTVNRADVVKAQLFKQRARHYHAFNMFFGTFEQLFNWRNARENFFPAFAQRRVKLTGKQLCQMVIERADIFGNRHFIVVEDHQHIRTDIARVIHRFKRHASGNRAIANDTDGAAIFAFFLGSNRNTNSGTDGG